MASNGTPPSAPVSSSVSPDVTPRRTASGTSAQAIAEQFSHQYYTVFSNYPRYLHRFYDQASVQNIVEVAENGTVLEETATNQQDIHQVILRLFPDAKARVDHISSQFSQNGGVMVQVAGTLFRRGRPDSSFVQSFFLAVQERGFFVRNDILRVTASVGSPNGRTRNEQISSRKPEGVPQPHTPRSGLSFGAHSSSQRLPLNGMRPVLPEQDQEHIHQILAETKQVLSSAAQQQLGENGVVQGLPPYSELSMRNSNSQSMPVPPSTQPVMQGEMGPGYEAPPPPQSPAANAQSNGFLLNPRRRNSSSGNPPFLQRNSSIFVRDVPNHIEERNLREVFEQFGVVTSVVIRTGKRDARFAFIDFSETSAMEQALSAELLVGGKRLLIEEKKPLVLRNKPRFPQARPGGDGSLGGSMDGNGGGMRLGVHPCR